MNTLEKLEQSGIVKEKGTQYFKVSSGVFTKHIAIKRIFMTDTFSCFPMHWFHMLQEGKYKQASVQYKRIVSWLEHESGLSEEDEKIAKALRLAAHLNLAMCFLKLQEPNQAQENCDKVFLHLTPIVCICCTSEMNKFINVHNYRHWTWMHLTRRLCSEGERLCLVWRSLTGQKMTSSRLFNCILPTRLPRARYNAVCFKGWFQLSTKVLFSYILPSWGVCPKKGS